MCGGNLREIVKRVSVSLMILSLVGGLGSLTQLTSSHDVKSAMIGMIGCFILILVHLALYIGCENEKRSLILTWLILEMLHIVTSFIYLALWLVYGSIAMSNPDARNPILEELNDNKMMNKSQVLAVGNMMTVLAVLGILWNCLMVFFWKKVLDLYKSMETKSSDMKLLIEEGGESYKGEGYFHHT